MLKPLYNSKISLFKTFFILLTLSFQNGIAQIGIGLPAGQDPQATLDVGFDNTVAPGFLMPRVNNLPEATNESPITEGMLVYYSGDDSSLVNSYYVYIDGEWKTLAETAGIVLPDTQAPTAPLSLTASNPTSTKIDLAWVASTDNVSVEGYYIYDNSDDSLVATVTGSTSTTISGLTSNTSYTFYATAYDAAGNESDASTTASETTTLPDTINSATFENGWDGWRDGGDKANRQTSGNCTGFNGSSSYGYIRLRDNYGDDSSMFLDNKNLSSYIYITIEFIYKTNDNYDSNDYFTFEYRDGDGNWTEVFRHTGLDTSCTTETITILASDYNFGTADDFKFESYASNSNEQARIHDVVITGYD